MQDSACFGDAFQYRKIDRLKLRNLKWKASFLVTFYPHIVLKGDVPLEAGHGILAPIFTIFVCMLWKLNISEGIMLL